MPTHIHTCRPSKHSCEFPRWWFMWGLMWLLTTSPFLVWPVSALTATWDLISFEVVFSWVIIKFLHPLDGFCGWWLIERSHLSQLKNWHLSFISDIIHNSDKTSCGKTEQKNPKTVQALSCTLVLLHSQYTVNNTISISTTRNISFDIL